MEELLTGKYLALYGQIGLYDAEDTSSYPNWKTGLEPAIFGEKGVAISVKRDMYINVTVYDHVSGVKGMRFCAEGQIKVGKKGLTIGNEVAASTDHLDWKEGLTSIQIFANGLPNEATTLVFILEHLS